MTRVILVIGVFMFVRLIVTDFSMNYSHIAMRLMFCLDFLFIFCINPLYIFTFFSSSHALFLFDSLIGLFLLVTTLYTAFASLIMTGLTHREVAFWWIVIHFVPFAAGLLCCHNLADPLGMTTAIFAACRVSAYLVYLVAYVAAAVTKFLPEIPHEKSASVGIGLVFFFVVVTVDVWFARSQDAEFKFSNHIFTHVAVATDILFFNFFNWPVDAADAART